MGPLEELLAQVDNLPTLPDVHVRAAQELVSADYDFNKVGELLAMDPVLTGRMIAMANSVLFGGVQRVNSVLEALRRLGASETRNLVLTAGVVQLFQSSDPRIDLREFWSLGLASGICARQMARELRSAPPDQAYLGGLVHSLGEVILAVHCPERFGRALRDAQAPGCDLVQAIWSEFGFTHSALTCAVLKRWNFSANVIEAVEFHLDPGEAPTQQVLASILLASDRICRELGFVSLDPGDGEQSWLSEIPDEFTQLLLDVGYSDLEAYVTEQKSHLSEVSTLVQSVFLGA